MSGWPHGLRGRLFLSHAVVVLVGAVTMVVVGAVVTRTVYERRLGGYGFGRALGRGPRRDVVAAEVTEGELVSLLDDSLWPALLAGSLAALLAAAIVAWLLGRRLLGPLDAIRDTTRQMAAGDYAAELPEPDTAELSSLAADIRELASHLAETEQRRTQLLGEVTHELRTPLTVVAGTMEGLIDGVIQPSPEVFGEVADETARLERLVGDLTLLSRADEGAIVLDVVDCDVADVATAAAERLRAQFDHAGVALIVPAVEPCRVRGDVGRLTQIVTNLVGNALGHTPAGGTVTVSVVRGDGQAIVEVADTGSGIEPAELDRIFQRFHRGSSPAIGRPVRAGRGIGLTIARSLARAHGGDVTAASDGAGQGATFRCVLPLIDR